MTNRSGPSLRSGPASGRSSKVCRAEAGPEGAARRSGFLLIALCASVLLTAVPARPAVPQETVQRAETFLTEALNDPDRLPLVMIGLRATGDKSLLPLFERLMRHTDREVRLLATASVPQAAGKKATDALLERLRRDPSMVIRARALLHLASLETIDDRDLIEAMKMADEEVQVFAARALAKRGKAAAAKPVLERLSLSRNEEIAPLARMTLLGLGQHEQIGELRKIVVDKATPENRLIVLLKQIREEKIADALPVATFLAKPEQPRKVRVQAYMTIGALDPQADDRLVEAIVDADSPMLRLNLLRILSDRPNPRAALRKLAVGGDLVAQVARFELVRRTGGTPAAQAAETLLRTEHPAVIEYVLARMRQDVEERKTVAVFYVSPALAYIRRTKLTGVRVGGDHSRVAAAVEALADLGTDEARAGLWDLLRQRDTARQQVVVAALYGSGNPDVADLAYPLLKSPYEKLRTYAALVRAKHGRQDAVPILRDLLDHAATGNDDVLVLASWHLLKLSGQDAAALRRIVTKVR